MKIIFAAAGLAILTGCASGTINTLSESRYACSATGSFLIFQRTMQSRHAANKSNSSVNGMGLHLL